jgi:hypothetical protein
LYSNTTGSQNTAVGRIALYLNSTGANNVAMGLQALYSNTTGSSNIGIGVDALLSNTTGSLNTAVGYQAGYSVTTGTENTFIGRLSGYFSTGGGNTCLGVNAGYNLTTGTKNTIVGAYTGNQGGLDIRTASSHIVLSDGDGNPRGYFNGSGNCFLTGLGSSNGDRTLRYTLVGGQVTYDTSSARYKNNIRNSVYGLAHVMQLRSTMFEYKDNGRTDVGLIAEEVNEIIPELVPKDLDGLPDAVSYDRMVSVLVKAIQELKAEVDSLKAQIQGA